MTAPKPQVYLNGCFVSRSDATIDIEDRGLLFADGVYEVVRYYAGQALAMDQHLARLRQSLAAIRLAEPTLVGQLDKISDQLVQRNGHQDAYVYWQITRGSAPRELAIKPGTKPTVLAMSYPAYPVTQDSHPQQVQAILAQDLRWHLCSIKSLALLPNVLARNAAADAGADEAILHRQAVVTEGTSSSVCIVRGHELWTHPADQWILGGITRQIVLELANKLGIPAIQQTYTVDDLLTADEVMICGTTRHIAAVVSVDNHQIGQGQTGPITDQLYHALIDSILKENI